MNKEDLHRSYGPIRNVKYGTTSTGKKAVKFEIGSEAWVSVCGREPHLSTTWNKVCAEVTGEIPTDLKDGERIEVLGEWFALNNELELGGTALFAHYIRR